MRGILKTTQQVAVAGAFRDSLFGSDALTFSIWLYALTQGEFEGDAYVVTLGAHYLSRLFSVSIKDVDVALSRLCQPDPEARFNNVRGGRRLIHVGTTGVTGYTRIYEVVLPPSLEKPKRATRPAMSLRLRFEILKRDGFRCRYCGVTSEQRRLHVDHVRPVCRGGPPDPRNLGAACDVCNIGKFNVELDQETLAKYQARYDCWLAKQRPKGVRRRATAESFYRVEGNSR